MSLNLRAIANRATGAINANIAATLRRSTGYTTSASGARVPSYADGEDVVVQMQALSKREVEHLDALNISNAHVSIYANTQLTPIDRSKQSGGDLLTIRGELWMVVALLEGWVGAGWCKAALSRQMPGTAP